MSLDPTRSHKNHGPQLHWEHMPSASTAKKGQSTVNYQSLVFDHPYLSCNDHCDQRLFQDIFSCYSFQKQLYADVLQGVIRHFAIFTRKYLCWSLFLIKLQAIRPVTFFQPCAKRDFNTSGSCENCKFFTNSFFYGTPLMAAFVSLIK